MSLEVNDEMLKALTEVDILASEPKIIAQLLEISDPINYLLEDLERRIKQ